MPPHTCGPCEVIVLSQKGDAAGPPNAYQNCTSSFSRLCMFLTLESRAHTRNCGQFTAHLDPLHLYFFHLARYR